MDQTLLAKGVVSGVIRFLESRAAAEKKETTSCFFWMWFLSMLRWPFSSNWQYRILRASVSQSEMAFRLKRDDIDECFFCNSGMVRVFFQ